MDRLQLSHSRLAGLLVIASLEKADYMGKNLFLYVTDEAVSEATREIVELGGRVTHQFGKSAIVARLPENSEVAGLKYAAETPGTATGTALATAAAAWKGQRPNGGYATGSITV